MENELENNAEDHDKNEESNQSKRNEAEEEETWESFDRLIAVFISVISKLIERETALKDHNKIVDNIFK